MTTLELLQKMEWDWDEITERESCPECRAAREAGHREACDLAAAIEREQVSSKALREERDARIAAEACLAGAHRWLNGFEDEARKFSLGEVDRYTLGVPVSRYNLHMWLVRRVRQGMALIRS